ncbi:unnamed protein product [Allacma fusca]|uniref:Uncharacterized protein n=1 Tax=Allacma fusca TaxID=39272 RepID=A0A8J2MG75_9HEXA|nr:unnamed protein product [Allacma fusca]
MAGTLSLWTLASCLLALVASSHAENFGRAVGKPLGCHGDIVTLQRIEEIAKECKYQMPKGRTAGKECPASCVQQRVGVLSDQFDVIKSAEQLSSNLLKSGLWPPTVAKLAADEIIKRNCNAKVEKSHECSDHLDFGDCIIDSTLAVCGATREEARKFYNEHHVE